MNDSLEQNLPLSLVLFVGAYVKYSFWFAFLFEIASYAPILWMFLPLLFFLKLACSLFKIPAPVFFILVSGLYSVLIVRVLYVTPCYYTRIWFSLRFVDFYFTSYITTKHTTTITRWHIMAWYNGMIDHTFHQNRGVGKRSSSSTYDWKELYQSHFPPLFCFASLLLILLLLFILQWRSNIVRNIIISHAS